LCILSPRGGVVGESNEWESSSVARVWKVCLSREDWVKDAGMFVDWTADNWSARWIIERIRQTRRKERAILGIYKIDIIMD